jgi:pyruvate dehydrogenase E2 component (dihydrolipoamide acetyltransferase)
MPFEIRVPRLGWSMETGVFVRWLKADGDAVKVGDALYELEGEKATQEIEAVDAGVLRIPSDAPVPGTEVAVGALLGYIAAKDESLPSSGIRQNSEPAQTPEILAKTVPAAGPAARRLARELGVELQAVASNGGRVRSEDVRSAAKPPSQREIVATPRARRVAKELGVDWKSLAGSGRSGRIRERDVREATPGANASGSLGDNASGSLSPRRRTIAQRMLASSQQTAAVTLTTRADATNLVSLRNQFKTTHSAVVPTYTDVVVKLVAVALAQHPVMTGRLEKDRIVLAERDELHIGMAVDTPAGLLVPVLRNVAALSLPQLAAKSLELVELARSGTLQIEDMSGGVFTVTNLGNYGIDAFTPIINVPETAILGLGAIRREAVVLEDDRIVPRDQMTLSLTFDHRLVDGAPAARFLQTVVQAIENPSAWLLQ